MSLKKEISELLDIVKRDYLCDDYALGEDYIKLIYQNEFGVGHLLDGPLVMQLSDMEYEMVKNAIAEKGVDESTVPLTENIEKFMFNENKTLFYSNDATLSDSTSIPNSPLDIQKLITCFDIGNGLIRMNYDDKLVSNFTAEDAFTFFSYDINAQGDKDDYMAKLDAVINLLGVFGVSNNNALVKKALEVHSEEAAGEAIIRQPHHSGIYKQSHNASYRLIHYDIAKLIPLVFILKNIIKEVPHDKDIFILVDGYCCAGKTTSAQFLEKFFKANLFHIDDYYLPKERRKGENYGQNIDFERLELLLQKITDKVYICEQRYDCNNGNFVNLEFKRPQRVNIIEGTYSHMMDFSACDDCVVIKLFFDLTEIEQEKRLKGRFTKKRLETYRKVWLKREKEYFNNLLIGVQMK